jgi:hypothetical protein
MTSIKSILLKQGVSVYSERGGYSGIKRYEVYGEREYVKEKEGQNCKTNVVNQSKRKAGRG